MLWTPPSRVQGLESELDSEISSLFSYDRDVTRLHRESDLSGHLSNGHRDLGQRHRDNVTNLHLMSPLEYAAMLKQVCTTKRTDTGTDTLTQTNTYVVYICII